MNSGIKRVSIAPMMDITNRHFRYFMRLFSPKIWLYTEMITTGALLHGNVERHLAYHDQEHPIALQLGGSDPLHLARAAKIAEEWGYDEINLNIGCPSDRVQAGAFGACLMKEAALVADCVHAIQDVVAIPVTVKTRIGVDELDSFEFLKDFIATVHAAGCNYFIIHARKAWLKGLSPKQNREVPPLDYSRVHAIKHTFPHLGIELNGGIKSLEDLSVCEGLEGVMLGRVAQQNAYLTAEMAATFMTDHPALPNQADILSKYLQYGFGQIQQGVPFCVLVKPLFSLYQGMVGAKQWRRMLSDISVLDLPTDARWDAVCERAVMRFT